MRTNVSFPTVSPGLIQDPRFSERMPAFAREAHQLKLTLKPIPQSTDAPSEHSSRTMPNGEKRGLSCICSQARGFHPSYGLRRGYQNGLAGTLICTGKPGSKSHEVLCVIASWV